jgi:hypothetical protein
MSNDSVRIFISHRSVRFGQDIYLRQSKRSRGPKHFVSGTCPHVSFFALVSILGPLHSDDDLLVSILGLLYSIYAYREFWVFLEREVSGMRIGTDVFSFKTSIGTSV